MPILQEKQRKSKECHAHRVPYKHRRLDSPEAKFHLLIKRVSSSAKLPLSHISMI